jgi:hypothetical protein
MTAAVPRNLALGVIGNCAFNALIDAARQIVWCCLPRPDGDPVFNALLAGQADGVPLRSTCAVERTQARQPSLPVPDRGRFQCSMVGIINAATRLSRRWETVL